MVSKAVMAGTAVIVIAIIAAGILALYKAPSPQVSNAAGAAGAQAKTNSGLLFNGSQYAQYAYLISGNATLSAAGRAATADFNITHSERRMFQVIPAKQQFSSSAGGYCKYQRIGKQP